MCWILILSALLSPLPPSPGISNNKKKNTLAKDPRSTRIPQGARGPAELTGGTLLGRWSLCCADLARSQQHCIWPSGLPGIFYLHRRPGHGLAPASLPKSSKSLLPSQLGKHPLDLLASLTRLWWPGETEMPAPLLHACPTNTGNKPQVLCLHHFTCLREHPHAPNTPCW